MLLTIKTTRHLVAKITEYAVLTGVSPNEYVHLAIAQKIARDEHEVWLRDQDKPKNT